MSGLTAASLGGLGALGDLQSKLHGAAIAARQSGLPEGSYQNLRRAADLLVTSEDYLPNNPDRARGRFSDAQRLFRAEEKICVDSNPAYCTRIGVETFASLFRTESTRISRAIESADVAPIQGPVQPTAAEWARMPALPPPTDMAITQRAVQQVNLQNQQASLSPQAQAAAIRNRWRATRRPAPARPLPRRAPSADQDMQELLALRTRKGLGAKVAAYSLAAVAAVSLAAILIPTKRRTR